MTKQTNNKQNNSVEVFANFHEANTPTMAEFKLSTCHLLFTELERVAHSQFSKLERVRLNMYTSYNTKPSSLHISA